MHIYLAPTAKTFVENNAGAPVSALLRWLPVVTFHGSSPAGCLARGRPRYTFLTCTYKETLTTSHRMDDFTYLFQQTEALSDCEVSPVHNVPRPLIPSHIKSLSLVLNTAVVITCIEYGHCLLFLRRSLEL